MVDNPVSLVDSIGAVTPHLAIVDIELLGARPWPLVALLRRRFPSVIVIVLADALGVEGTRQATEAGVARVLERDRVTADLVVTAREVLRLQGREASNHPTTKKTT